MEKNYQPLSEQLIQARLLAELSLDEVSSITGISQYNLNALEEGNYYKLPSKVYVQGYLKSLAQVYSLETNTLLTKYREECQEHNKAAEINPKPVANTKLTLTSKKLLSGTLVLIFMLVGGYLFWQIQSLTAAPRLVVDDLQNNSLVTDEEILISGKTEPGAVLTINQQRIQIENDGSFEKWISLSDGENIIVIKAINRFEKSTEINKRIVASLPPQVLGEQNVGPEQTSSQ